MSYSIVDKYKIDKVTYGDENFGNHLSEFKVLQQKTSLNNKQNVKWL
jgi:hypothetical protein